MAIIKIGSLVKGDHKAAKSSVADYFRSGSIDEGEECLADLHDSLKNGKRFQNYFIAGYGEVVYNSKTAKYADAIREEKKIHSDDAHAIIVAAIIFDILFFTFYLLLFLFLYLFASFAFAGFFDVLFPIFFSFFSLFLFNNHIV